ncbi:tissue factor-like isoform X2 [Takifugu flavidus]|uniref:tissue factor-like isoform X2 n=1 Tax=Takifugu flavidus TaxID=433684 RepID=UPI0025442B53|nr:tissue factor-like isoform X2 [Takifugu flavidus]
MSRRRNQCRQTGNTGNTGRAALGTRPAHGTSWMLVLGRGSRVDMKCSALFLMLLLHCVRSVSASYPRAYNVTWKSTNFKTVLTWDPKPSHLYSYTVEFFRIGGDKMRNPHCIRSSFPQCDLSNFLTELRSSYMAEILSEPPLGETSDLIEFPYSRSPRFCPYNDTDIGKPDFKLEVSADKKKTSLFVTDPLTALFKDGRQLNIRDIFSDQLMYKVTYRKNKSTGKKEHISKTNVIELTNLDQGESYCFSIQAYIPSRTITKQLGEQSQFQCSEENSSILKDYSPVVIFVAVLFILLLVGSIIGATVACCKHRRKVLQKEKEAVPLAPI